ncbi:unnamed protein product [Parnassius mnemosyne]|uniref:DUF659 domain-containing protein n=1 Tax=Parnassius mnemosyne TaxID=213953 RepID=A0AAV1L8T6_9NEOP
MKKFIHALDSRYELPDKNTLKCTLIPKVYENLKNKLEEALAITSYLNITTDMCTSNANKGIQALTCHFINDGILLSPLLKVTKVEGHHNSETMAHVINNILEEYNIHDKIVTIVTDNASVMKETADMLKIRHSP